MKHTLGIIGFGEVGRIFGRGLLGKPGIAEVVAWDVRFADPEFGPQARSTAQTLTDWGMDAKAVSDKLGVASAIKMSRSIMIKGLEALVIESYVTARAYGVEDFVLPTLQETFPQIDWARQGAYFFSRVVQHGKRRSEEMFEAANTVKETGVAPTMATAIAEKQAWVAQLAQNGVFAELDAGSSWQDYADRLIAKAR